MLGHQLIRKLSDRFDVMATVRGQADSVSKYDLFSPDRTFFGCDIRERDTLEGIVAETQPNAVINAIGIVKQRLASDDILQSLEVNSVLPHRLAQLCRDINARLIHISTDCIFDGTKGGYRETDTADATDIYGRTKYLGEVTGPNCLTLRTSIIGLELKRNRSLIEWFLRQDGTISGYRKAIFSGVSTAELCRVIALLLLDHPELHGLYHLASKPISKHDLLVLFASHLKRDAKFRPDDSLKVDRSLVGDRFCAQTGYVTPSWDDMLQELAGEVAARSSP
ncbi:MAG: SDR family oxidoreductase [Rhizobiales bacterium]|nr:SDR family oxidoreductase [Hyphomicrobiales bacterium]MBO6698975.1 SDR family oxidoreductase [Hyphomicrobiales bacterium]MBO6734772.1 SDR family oxidoreductase [Hyphomicrobiales bacterium]MBO6911422.1 SDR family oxidoreductase [Hyphomicrobiales bacterium]MBO6955445.1 SDR family oxidoreductase [Hyphomicrobiales bacterium]